MERCKVLPVISKDMSQSTERGRSHTLEVNIRRPRSNCAIISSFGDVPFRRSLVLPSGAGPRPTTGKIHPFEVAFFVSVRPTAAASPAAATPTAAATTTARFSADPETRLRLRQRTRPPRQPVPQRRARLASLLPSSSLRPLLLLGPGQLPRSGNVRGPHHRQQRLRRASRAVSLPRTPRNHATCAAKRLPASATPMRKSSAPSSSLTPSRLPPRL
ncbi:hypothetical protein L596_005823 [Steinernema carpocapsae]|uniref:Uncharacterized protein n=1 Tax=Steinernema carpocapsae TaxID=34508 RepID=A0A4U8V1I5_STECR|nr:hypothetical protein L596_005823 [Steinernema carpocapsae]